MMEHLGGAEDGHALDRRNERYATLTDGGMFVVELGEERAPAGTVGYWQSERSNVPVYESGWMIFPEFGRRGVATQAVAQIIARARGGTHRYLHAFPSTDNAPSNALCAKAGFERLGPCDIEYPKGRTMHANDWRYDLRSTA